MQKYPYLERNTQKLKNHTRRTGLLCKGSHVPWFENQAIQPTLSPFNHLLSMFWHNLYARRHAHK